MTTCDAEKTVSNDGLSEAAPDTSEAVCCLSSYLEPHYFFPHLKKEIPLLFVKC